MVKMRFHWKRNISPFGFGSFIVEAETVEDCKRIAHEELQEGDELDDWYII